MAGCRATKANGDPCKGSVQPPDAYCWAHHPTNAEQRRRTASRGGKSKPSREIRAFKQEVRDLIAAVENGVQDRADAAVMLQGYRLLKDLVELERRVRELDELEARIEQLEQSTGNGKEK